MTLVISQEFIITTQEEYDKWLDDHEYIPQNRILQKTINKSFDDPDVYPHIGEGINSEIWDSPDNPQKIESVTYFYEQQMVMAELPFYCVPEGGEWEKDFEKYAELHGWEVV